jgi:hypothetical protein
MILRSFVPVRIWPKLSKSNKRIWIAALPNQLTRYGKISLHVNLVVGACRVYVGYD